jgi:protein TonB
MKNFKYLTYLLTFLAVAFTFSNSSNASIISDEYPIAEHYEGATAKLKEDIHAAIVYPPTAKRNRIQGTQNIKVTLMPDGTLTNFRCLNSLGGGCCEEATRVIKTLKFKAPGYQANYTIPVRFKL